MEQIKNNISVAMATYNGEKYIREQLDSLLRQTLPFDEIVITDDCSTDNTWNILEEYAKSDKRFHLYHNDRNLGYLKNFEKAIRLTTGKCIALCDQDDVWTENHIASLYGIMGNKLVSVGDSLITDADGKSLGITLGEHHNLPKVMPTGTRLAQRIIYTGNPFQGAAMMINRDYLNVILPFPDNLVHDMWIGILAAFCGDCAYTHDVVVEYRQHENNVTHDHRTRRRSTLSMVLGNFMKKNHHGYLMPALTEVEERIGTSLNAEQKECLHSLKKVLNNRNFGGGD